MSAAADHFTSISDATQILLLKTARFVKTRKPFDYLALLNAMQADWEQVMELMVSRC
jgi:hypothetical protein